jgi:16S rRNA (adenine1518-N6/adenine1519-N6)-dimethyltransferase
MFQQEVAERIVAKAGHRCLWPARGAGAVALEARIAMKVHRSAFTPPPKVMSAVVHITPGEDASGGLRCACWNG